jgi:hypothetical protein
MWWLKMQEYYELWDELEAKANAKKQSLKKKGKKTSCYLGWNFEENVPYFAITIATEWSKKEVKKYSKSINGMELGVSGKSLELKQKDITSNFVFQKMCIQIIELILGGKSEDDAAREVLTEYINFFKKNRQLFGSNEQAGLYGELSLLENLLKEHPTKQDAVIQAWKGPLDSYHDFQFKKGSIEVKTTRGKNPVQVIIGNEKQLANASGPPLWLNAYSLVDSVGGDTLPAIIERIESKLRSAKQAKRRFIQMLTLYLPRDEFETLEGGYNITKTYWFKIKDGFPAITEIPKGIGSVSYGLLLNEIDNKFASSERDFCKVIDL